MNLHRRPQTPYYLLVLAVGWLAVRPVVAQPAGEVPVCLTQGGEPGEAAIAGNAATDQLSSKVYRIEGYPYPVVRWSTLETETELLSDDSVDSAVAIPRHAARADRLIIKLRSGNSISRARKELEKQLSGATVEVEELGFDSYVLSFELVSDTYEKSSAGLAEQFKKTFDSSYLEFTEPDYLYVTASHANPRTPSDRDFKDPNRAFELIEATAAWGIEREGARGARETKVAIIDTGIDFHPDLHDNIWLNTDESDCDQEDGQGDSDDKFKDDRRGWDAIAGRGFCEKPFDGDGHGTSCASIIGAVGNNGIGTAGVNWEVSLIPIRAIGDSRCGQASHLQRAIDYAVAVEADIISASWGFFNESSLIRQALERAKEKGVLVVAAAGNEGLDIDRKEFFPAAYPLENIISVAATTLSDGLWGDSNCGCSNVDLAAPGVGVRALKRLQDDGGDIETLNPGTSFATAFVAGAAALAMATFEDEKADFAKIRNRLLATGDQLDALAGRTCSGRRLNLHQLLSEPGPFNEAPLRCREDHSGCPPDTPVRCQSAF